MLTLHCLLHRSLRGARFLSVAGLLAGLAGNLPAAATKTAPAITTQPKSVNVLPGAAASFTVKATGTAKLIYLWKKDTTTTLKDGNGLTGTATATLKIAKVTATNGGQYQVVVSNAQGNVTSGMAKLTVLPEPGPKITAQPKLTTMIHPGKSFSLTVKASGKNLTYQWYVNTVIALKDETRKDGAVLSGTKTATLKVTKATSGESGGYTVVVSNSGGNVTSNPGAVLVL